MDLLFFSSVCLFGSCCLTGLLRYYALHQKLLDIPNQRSSHQVPMPRGGGLAFVICFCVAFVELFWHRQISGSLFWGIFISAIMVALMGLCDDRYNLSAKYRLIGHIIASIIVIYSLGGVNQFINITNHWLLGLANVVLVIYLVWFINLFNFMDGIDGIAAIEAIAVCLGGAVLFWIDGHYQAMAMPILLAASIGGFLLWNFPPARIFMGDVGSGFLGLLIAILSLLAAQVDMNLFYAWLILSGVFICDASVTLLFRIVYRDNIFKAHCTHAYQNAARAYRSHRLVDWFVILINLGWLFPIALLVQQHYIHGVFGVFMAYAPIVFLVIKFSPGKIMSSSKSHIYLVKTK